MYDDEEDDVHTDYWLVIALIVLNFLFMTACSSARMQAVHECEQENPEPTAATVGRTFGLVGSLIVGQTEKDYYNRLDACIDQREKAYDGGK